MKFKILPSTGRVLGRRHIVMPGNHKTFFDRSAKLTRIEAAELDPELATWPSRPERESLFLRVMTPQGCPI
jgi:hypothetical protein